MFQQDHRLPPTGEYDAATEAELTRSLDVLHQQLAGDQGPLASINQGSNYGAMIRPANSFQASYRHAVWSVTVGNKTWYVGTAREVASILRTYAAEQRPLRNEGFSETSSGAPSFYLVADPTPLGSQNAERDAGQFEQALAVSLKLYQVEELLAASVNQSLSPHESNIKPTSQFENQGSIPFAGLPVMGAAENPQETPPKDEFFVISRPCEQRIFEKVLAPDQEFDDSEPVLAENEFRKELSLRYSDGSSDKFSFISSAAVFIKDALARLVALFKMPNIAYMSPAAVIQAAVRDLPVRVVVQAGDQFGAVRIVRFEPAEAGSPS